jgi:hypothetical protein
MQSRSTGDGQRRKNKPKSEDDQNDAYHVQLVKEICAKSTHPKKPHGVGVVIQCTALLGSTSSIE